MTTDTLGGMRAGTAQDRVPEGRLALTNPSKGQLVPALLAVGISLAAIVIIWAIAPLR